MVKVMKNNYSSHIMFYIFGKGLQMCKDDYNLGFMQMFLEILRTAYTKPKSSPSVLSYDLDL